MPHPGLKVATDKRFDGRLAGIVMVCIQCINAIIYMCMCIWVWIMQIFCSLDIDGDFKLQLSDLAPLLLHASRLVVKTINGNSVTGKDLLEYFRVSCITIMDYVCKVSVRLQVYMKIYQGEDLPEPKSMLEVSILYIQYYRGGDCQWLKKLSMPFPQWHCSQLILL